MQKIRVILILALIAIGTVFSIKNASAQFAVIDPSNIAQSIVNTTKEIAHASKTVSNTLDTFKETKKVYEQGKEYYDALKSVNHLVKDAKKVQKTLLLLGEITDIYITNFQLMLSDKNFRADELNAIAHGYAKLLDESADVLSELKNIININGLSMTDAERMERIDKAYDAISNYRNLVAYYTRKNISVSYLRAKKINDTDRIIGLYGTANDKYW